MGTLQDIADIASELCDPHQHTERIWGWTTSRHKKVIRTHTTTQEGLVAQLYNCAVDPVQAVSDVSRRPAPGSRPPGSFEALAVHTWITLGAAKWCWNLKVDQRETVEDNIRALVGAAATLDSDTAKELLEEMRAWRHRASVMTGWALPMFAPRVPCPGVDCGKSNGLRINLSHQEAYCLNCGAQWDEGTIGVLGDHVRAYTEGRGAANTARVA